MQYGYTVYILTWMGGRMNKQIDEQTTFKSMRRMRKNYFTTCSVSE